MGTLLLHHDKVFEDQTLYLTGNAYIGCTFKRCALVLKGVVAQIERCAFESCIWHLDFVVHDSDKLNQFVSHTAPFIAKSLPKAPDSGAK